MGSCGLVLCLRPVEWQLLEAVTGPVIFDVFDLSNPVIIIEQLLAALEFTSEKAVLVDGEEVVKEDIDNGKGLSNSPLLAGEKLLEFFQTGIAVLLVHCLGSLKVSVLAVGKLHVGAVEILVEAVGGSVGYLLLVSLADHF